MTESQEKFLRLVAARVPLDRVVEVHLFPPIRSGAFETGVAVLAVGLEPSPAAVAPVEAVAAPDESADAGATGGVAGSDALACDPTEDAAGPVPRGADEEPAVVTPDVAEGGAHVPGGEMGEAADAEAATGGAGAPPQDQISPVASADASSSGRESAPADARPDAAEAGAHVPSAGDGDAVAERAARPAPTRHTVYTARYRYTIKGPDRGKFDVDVQAEADAPLVTIDLVVRGVQQRANEPAEAERLTGDRLRALAAPPAATVPGLPGAPAGGSPGRAA